MGMFLLISPEDVIETVCEHQDYTEHMTQRSRRNIGQLATSTPLARRSIFRPKSPTDRPFKCPKLNRCKLYQWRAIDSIRKTKSSEVPAKHHLVDNNWQSRTETASTPHLVDNDEKSGSINEEKLKHERQQRTRLNRSAICFDNIRWICAFLNSVILILSVLYFGSALAFTFSENILLLVMKNKVYISLVASFYIVSFLLWMIAISGFYVLWKISRKIKMHACLTLAFGILILSTIFFQNSTQQSIESDVETQMRSSLKSDNEDFGKDGWDYFHNTFKCCGVTGFLDWCHRENSKINETQTESFLGTYFCSIPSSCCARYINEYKNSHENKLESCTELLEMGRIRNTGCVDAVKKEIYHLGKMYKIITGGASGTLVLLSIMSVALFSRLIR
ncbi:uncharacterized protein LOC100680288 isoform X2 [Nasonia vitripennis]|uniref:Tetraspanin n=1 Tax=Nasonia vitripennis TaxID=7425 RepID=A0A7M7HAB7_NASVI|nr:uncharacterized protein LOC100680288 isoform X2 [Nasonia vitripennis]